VVYKFTASELVGDCLIYSVIVGHSFAIDMGVNRETDYGTAVCRANMIPPRGFYLHRGSV